MTAPSARLCTAVRFDAGNARGERKTWWVFTLTLLTMVVEVVAGYVTGSMALMADGWHMSSHALALGLAGGAYVLARRYAHDGRFAFGTWKIEVLASFASALLLIVVAALMVVESVDRLRHPVTIDYRDALMVALAGLVVNLVSAWLLHDDGHAPAQHDDEHHDHAHHGHAHHGHAHHDPASARQARHPHHHGHHHGDLNLRGAYLHVLADAATSVAALAALAGGLVWGWAWLDPVVGCIGAAVICVWAAGLLRESGAVLLDREMDVPLVGQVRARLQALPGTVLRDLHLWRVGRAQFACVVSLESAGSLGVADYRRALADFGQLAHLTIEVVPAT